jgi:adenosylhomocysteine nucleosidase
MGRARGFASLIAFIVALSLLPVAAHAAGRDATPRTAVVCAFGPEWTALRRFVVRPRETSVNGVRFVTGEIEGRPVVLFQSGVSMVNAAMTTQLALDRFHIRRIVFSGIAGGVDPALNIGDVVAPDRWAQYLESVFARADGAGFTPPDFPEYRSGLSNFGMIYPHAPAVLREGDAAVERKLWFEADDRLLETARRIAPKVVLQRCVSGACLSARPKVIIGGSGVSASVFMDNAAFRDYLAKAFGAEAVDMESAAVAQVAYANKTPFIAFRSLSDLAGGQAGEKQVGTFMRLASENSAEVVKAFVGALP